jgi:dephospho-CoA kinase
MSKLVIGIGGGIGSGKSTVAHIFSVLGFPVYDSDRHAKELYLHEEIKFQVIELLGKKSYHLDGTPDRNFISNLVFSNENLLNELNQIIHPAVKKDFEIWCNNFPESTHVVKESALLFEKGIYKECDLSILVDADEELRIKRVVKRDGASVEAVKQRIRSQVKSSLFYAEADLIIQNNNNDFLLPLLLQWVEKNIEKSF